MYGLDGYVVDYRASSAGSKPVRIPPDKQFLRDWVQDGGEISNILPFKISMCAQNHTVLHFHNA